MRYDLHKAAESIARIANNNGGDLRFELREPAIDAQIRACENLFGFALPPSQRQFLRKHNGAFFRAFGRHGRLHPQSFTTPAYRLDLFGTNEIIARARELEETFEMAYSDEMPFFTARRARQFVPCAALYEGDERILLASDRPTAGGEFTVIDVSVASTDWVAEGTEYEAAERAFMEARGYGPEPANVLAASFSEFVERSLHSMIETERGFDYAEPDSENLWEKR